MTSSLVRRRRLRRASPPAETALWYYLRDRRLAGFKFRRQQAWGPFILDFFCWEQRLERGPEQRERGYELLLFAGLLGLGGGLFFFFGGGDGGGFAGLAFFLVTLLLGGGFFGEALLLEGGFLVLALLLRVLNLFFSSSSRFFWASWAPRTASLYSFAASSSRFLAQPAGSHSPGHSHFAFLLVQTQPSPF